MIWMRGRYKPVGRPVGVIGLIGLRFSLKDCNPRDAAFREEEGTTPGVHLVFCLSLSLTAATPPMSMKQAHSFLTCMTWMGLIGR